MNQGSSCYQRFPLSKHSKNSAPTKALGRRTTCFADTENKSKKHAYGMFKKLLEK
jgi:hypothetical protein